MESLPEINLNLNTAKDTAKKSVSQAKSSLKAAGSLVAKKAERTKLVTVTLPRAYAELGKSIYKDGSRRDEFTDLFQSVDILLAERKRIADEGKARPAGTTVTDKAKKIAADAADMAKAKAVDLQAFQAFAKLGESVFQHQGSSAGSSDLVEPIAKAIARRDALDREAGAIHSSAKGKWITPKRIAVGFGVLVGLAVLGNLVEDGRRNTPSTNDSRGRVKESGKGAATSNHEISVKLPKAKGVSEVERNAYLDGWKRGYKDGLLVAMKLEKAIKTNANPQILAGHHEAIQILASSYHEQMVNCVRTAADLERQRGEPLDSGSSYLRARGWSTGAWDGVNASAGKYLR